MELIAPHISNARASRWVLFPNLITRQLSFILPCMPLTEDIITSRYQIGGYQDNAIIINDIHYHTSLVVSAEVLHTPWAVNSIESLDKNNLQVVFDLNPEVVLLGTGARQQFPAASVLALFGQQGIGVEAMNNGALCRSFNILVAEGRAVVAGILLAS
ncbi:MAG: hypothetical protein GY820_08655 [Gammaproteobacteria bacterium]|nr:hypothetical protein [Gammaproteobacteria bacterium]